MLTCVVLPVTDINEIEKTFRALRDMQRAGDTILPEVADWMDWAEAVLIMEETCSTGIFDGLNADTQTLIGTSFIL